VITGLQQGAEKYMHFVDYNDLISDPEETLQKIYEFLEEEPYEHDFSNILNKHEESDLNTYGLADMHKVRKELKKTSANPKDVLPPSILGRYKQMEFWKQKGFKVNIVDPT
jgi:sulfotransferase